MITFVVDLVRQLDAFGRTVFYANRTALALLDVNFDSSFECHIC